MKKIGVLALLFLVTASAFASGAQETPKPAVAPVKYELANVDSSKIDEIILWHNRGGGAGALLEKTMIPQFNETIGKEKGIKITPVFQSSADLIGKLKAVILAKDVKNMPDLIQVFAGDTEYMSTVPNMLPVSKLIGADSTFSLDAILPSLVGTYSYAGQLNSLPFHASTMVMYYNKTAFKEAGLNPDNPPTTLGEVAEIAPKLLKKQGNNTTRYALTMGVLNQYLNHFIAGQGEYSFVGNEENGHTGRMTEVLFDKNGTMKAFLENWKKMIDTGAIQTTDIGNQARDEFLAGTSAILFTSNNVLVSMKKNFKEKGWELGVTTLPKVNASDTGGVCPGGSSIYVLDRGDAQKVAKGWEFIKTWVNADYQAQWAIGTGCIPVNKGSMESAELKAFLVDTPEFWVAYNALLSSHPKVQEHLAPTQQAFASIFKAVGEKFTAGGLTVDQAVAEMAKQCNEALSEFNRANPIT